MQVAPIFMREKSRRAREGGAADVSKDAYEKVPVEVSCAFWQGQGWIRDGGFVSHGGSPKSSFWNQIFQYKPATVLGIPHFRKPPYVDLKNFKDI